VTQSRINDILANIFLVYDGAKQFLADNGITYIIDDGETKQWESHPLTYPFLKPIWHNTKVTLYEVE
jgi:hypothetical protein